MKEILKEGKNIFIIAFILFIIPLSAYIFFNYFWGLLISFLGLFLIGYTIFFLRIPNRKTLLNPDLIYASADGYIFDIDLNSKAPVYIDEPVHKIVIFMHVASVHWNLSPIEGTIEFESYQKGSFKSALKESSWTSNEHQFIGIKGKSNVKILISMVAGLIARRIRFKAKKGDYLRQGDRFGLIKYGSANIIYLPANFKVEIKKGQKTRAGLTIIARRLNP